MKPGWHSESILIYWVLVRCNTRYIRPDYTIENFLKMIEKYKIMFVTLKAKDIFAAIKTNIIESLDFSTVKIAMTTGEHLSQKVREEFQKYLKNGFVCPLYGVSDVGGALTSVALGKPIPQSVGKITKNTLFKIISETGEALGPNEIGEIYCQFLGAPFTGYYKDEKLSKESVTDDNYFKTGDIGYFDENLNLFLVERKKYLISYRGGWINQSDVERIIIDHVKGIDGVCVLDVENDEHGVMPIIVIIPEKGITLKEDEIIKIVHQHHEIKFDTRVFFMDKLPLTISGKYKKHLVRNNILKFMK